MLERFCRFANYPVRCGLDDAVIANNSSYYDFNNWINDATTLYAYDGQMCVEEDYTAPANATGTYTNRDITRYTLGARGIDMIEAERIQSAPNDSLLNQKRYSFPIYDGHGNMLATLIRTSGGYQLTNEKRYDAWGGIKATASGAGDGLVNPKEGYCANLGHKLDSESELIYMRARYYEPATGRFITQDPALDGTNWFVYCKNDPILGVDSDGRLTEKERLGIKAFFLKLFGSMIMGAGIVTEFYLLPAAIAQVAELAGEFNSVRELMRALDKVDDFDDSLRAQLQHFASGFRWKKNFGAVRGTCGSAIGALIGYSMYCQGELAEMDAWWAED